MISSRTRTILGGFAVGLALLFACAEACKTCEDLKQDRLRECSALAGGWDVDLLGFRCEYVTAANACGVVTNPGTCYSNGAPGLVPVEVLTIP